MGTGKVLAVISGTCLRVVKPVGRVLFLFCFRPRPGTIGTAREQEIKIAGHLRVHVVVLVLIYKANDLPPLAGVDARK